MAYTSTAQKPVSPEARVMTAEGRYDELCTYRSPFLMRARQAAELTIPALMPPEGSTGALQFVTPFQSVGARGVNNLAAKLLLALFPPGSSFFRLTIDPYTLEKLVGQAQSEGDDPTKEIEAALGRVERAVITRMEQKNYRTTLYETFRHLIAAGNALLLVLPKTGVKLFHLDKFCVKRDLEGNPVELVVRECLSPRTLPPAARAIYARKGEKESQQKDSAQNTLYLYTWVRLDTSEGGSGHWKVHQELLGEQVPGTEGTYPKDKSPFLPLRWTQVYGEDYGRGMVEEYIGDLRSCESLSQSIVEFAAIAAKVLFLVNEGGTTSKKKIADAPSGAVIDGDAKDVTILTLEKFADFQVAKLTRDEITQSLAQAFLLNSSVQRQAERVTAEEIRFMAGELEQALGGTYSLLAEELQRPLVVRLMLQMQKAKELPHLPESISPQITTGMEGLGRSGDELKLRMLIQGIAQDVGPEAVAEYINVGGLISRRATALGIDTDGLVRTEEEVQQSRQQAMMQQMTEKLGPSGIKAMSDQAKVETQQQSTEAVPQ